MKWPPGLAPLFALAVLPTTPVVAEEVVTFSQDIAPLLYAKCASCHQPGGLAPFSLLTYADARAKAGKLARIVLDRAMPPWLPISGEFAPTRKVEVSEVALLRRWVEAGAPEGDPAKLPPAPKFPTDWSLGKPDLVLTMPAIYPIGGEGPTVTAHFVFPLGLKEERFLRAVEILPGNPKVVQSARGLLDRSGRARELAGQTGAYERFGGPGFFPSGETPSQGPGQSAYAFAEDVGLPVGPDTDFVLQMRYRPSGELQTDRTQVGLYFTKQAPARSRSGVFLGSESFVLPPKSKSQVVRDEIILPVALEVTDVRPNLLLFGTAIRAWAELPDGRKISLLEIANWKHPWQETYRFAQPIALPKNTKIKVLWEFDNPGDVAVRSGQTARDEAPALWLGGNAANLEAHAALNSANLLHYTALQKAAKRPK